MICWCIVLVKYLSYEIMIIIKFVFIIVFLWVLNFCIFLEGKI